MQIVREWKLRYKRLEREGMAWHTGKPPRRKGSYLITLETPYERQVWQAYRAKQPKEDWFWQLIPSGIASDEEVIAWQKWPKPYEGA